MTQIIFDGRLLPADEPILGAANRGVRYGDGLFETMKMVDGKIALFDRHMQRLWKGLDLLGFELPGLFSPSMLWQQIERLAEKNKTLTRSRIRLMIVRGNGGLFDPVNHHPHYIIEATALPDHYRELNENGWVIDVYPDARKSCDMFSNCKSNQFLPYLMAAGYAKKQRLNDCLVLNQYGRICDSSIANVFVVKSGQLFTPSLEEGPVAGVMRNLLIDILTREGYKLFEQPVEMTLLAEADEVFLSNALYGIRSVRQFGNTTYGRRITEKIYSLLDQTIQTI